MSKTLVVAYGVEDMNLKDTIGPSHELEVLVWRLYYHQY